MELIAAMSSKLGFVIWEPPRGPLWNPQGRVELEVGVPNPEMELIVAMSSKLGFGTPRWSSS